MIYNKENMKKEEVIYWQGKPNVPVCDARTFVLYVIPAIILLCIWSGISGVEEYMPRVKDVLVFLRDNIILNYTVLVMILGLMLRPLLRWFLYYKRIEYVFTSMRALAYYRSSNEIDFEIEAADIPKMQQSFSREGLINLHTFIVDQGELHERQGEIRYVKVGFEGIPADILEHYT